MMQQRIYYPRIFHNFRFIRHVSVLNTNRCRLYSTSSGSSNNDNNDNSVNDHDHHEDNTNHNRHNNTTLSNHRHDYQDTTSRSSKKHGSMSLDEYRKLLDGISVDGWGLFRFDPNKAPMDDSKIHMYSKSTFEPPSDQSSTSPPPPDQSSTLVDEEDEHESDWKEAIDVGDVNKYVQDALVKLTPADIVTQLDRYIVGQKHAKRAIAVALRNRWRRQQISDGLRDEIVPANILMIGSTGVGKTEIARRVAKLASSPFVKVEATKFTEVGYVGRDVDSIVRDLVENAVIVVKDILKKLHKSNIEQEVEETILSRLQGNSGRPMDRSGRKDRSELREQLRNGDLEDVQIMVDMPPPASDGSASMNGDGGNGGGNPGGGGGSTLDNNAFYSLIDHLAQGHAGRRELRKMSVREARQVIEETVSKRLLNPTQINEQAVKACEQYGIVFIDEIDKIASVGRRHGSDASDEGVQRDLLPLIEGTTVTLQKYGPVNTDHILFIAAGAFSVAKPSDLLAELQGRLPIRCELNDLSEDDMYRILTEPENNLPAQQVALMKTEKLTLNITDDAKRYIAKLAFEVNKAVENLGARRLHSILDTIMDDISFDAPSKANTTIVIDREMVMQKTRNVLPKQDLSKWVI